MPVRIRLVVLLLLTLGPLAAIAVIVIPSERQQATEHLAQELLHATRAAAADERRLVDDTRRLLQSLSQRPEVRSAGIDCGPFMLWVLEQFPVYANLEVVDGEGITRCAAHGGERPPAPVTADWFATIRETASFATGAYATAGTETRPTLVAALPVVVDGQFAGAVVASLTTGWLPIALDSFGLPEGWVSLLLDRNGAIVAAHPIDVASAVSLLPRGPFEQAAAPGGSFAAVGWDGIQRLFAVVPLIDGSTQVITTVPLASALPPAPAVWLDRFGWPLAAGLVGILIAWLASEILLTRPLRVLYRTARAFLRDHMAPRPVLEGAAVELTAIAAALSRLADRLLARETELARLTDQRDRAFREIHHRVKNNLQTVISLINLRAWRLDDTDAQALLGDIHRRIQALALVHRHLYENDTLEGVDASRLLRALANYLWRSAGPKSARAQLALAVEPLALTADQAIALSLFATEALTNALEHAFVEGVEGAVTVTLERRGEDARLEIADTGRGVETLRLRDAPGTLGLTLLHGFADQLDGEITITGNGGTKVTLLFPLAGPTRAADLPMPASAEALP